MLLFVMSVSKQSEEVAAVLATALMELTQHAFSTLSESLLKVSLLFHQSLLTAAASTAAAAVSAVLPSYATWFQVLYLHCVTE